MFHTSSIGAQQKKKKMAEKITKKNENVKLVLLQSQLILKPDNNHDDLDPQIISVKCDKKVQKSNISHFQYWRESGDWVALHNITSRGSTQALGLQQST